MLDKQNFGNRKLVHLVLLAFVFLLPFVGEAASSASACAGASGKKRAFPLKSGQTREVIEIQTTQFGQLRAPYIIDVPVQIKTEPVIMLHGLGRDHRYLTKATKSFLQQGVPVIRIDLANSGLNLVENGAFPKPSMQTDVEIAQGILASLKLGPAVIIGHSRGGGVAIRLAAQHPELVQAVVPVNSLVQWLAPSPTRQALALQLAMQKFASQTGRLFNPWYWNPFTRDIVEQSYQAWDKMAEDYANNVPDMMDMIESIGLNAWAQSKFTEQKTRERNGPDEALPGLSLNQEVAAAVEIFKGMYHETVLPDAEAIPANIPLLIIYSENDPRGPVYLMHELAGKHANSRMELISGTGHYTPVANPDAFVDKVLTFTRPKALGPSQP